jgi:hypothetical protein
MSAAEPDRPGAPQDPAAAGQPADGRIARTGGRRWSGRWALAVGGLLLVALALRLWGIAHGMPYVYNIDENSHFVPKAIELFGTDWNPHYFVNPPLLTYVLHIVFAVWFGSGDAVRDALQSNPREVFVLARVVVAILGTAAVGLLYLAGARLGAEAEDGEGAVRPAVGGRWLGFLAAALLAVAFLPVFYAHLALNDAPTLAPVCLALWGIAGIYRRGRTRDYLVAGIGVGLAAATKYTGGIVLLPLLLAAGIRWHDGRDARALLLGLAAAGGAALLAFLVGNPFAVFDSSAFRDGLSHQSDATGSELGKLGQPQESGLRYYVWTLTWGLGWLPMLAAAGGAAWAIVRDRRLAVLLVPAPLAFLLFMGLQTRFFGRWLLPIYPLACLLAALGALALVGALERRGPARPWLRPALLGAALVLLCGQGLVYAMHSGRTLAREDTRAATRAWMVDHVPAGSKVVVEPVVPDAWARDVGSPHNRWNKYPVFRTAVQEDGTIGPSRVVGIEDYERTLRPRLLKAYAAGGYCHVVVGSTQKGRAFADRHEVPNAIRYYEALAKEADVVHRESPWAKGERQGFNFDWSFDAYPLAYERAGPEMTVYRLKTGRCAEK